jgi:hypothetical protein
MVDLKVKSEGKPEGIGILQWLAIKLFLSRIGVDTTMLTKIWDFMNGKKTIVGAVITAVSVGATYLPAVLAFFGVDAVKIATYVGISTTVVGVAHKIYKFIYKEDHP